MKKIILVLALGCSFAAVAQAPTVDELNLPTSPALVLLGQSPANIEKPVNPKALAVSLINASDNGGAVEFAPFWLIDQPYTFKQDVQNHFPFWQTLGLSVASARQNDTTQISAGFRVQLFRQYADETGILTTQQQIVMALSSLPIDEGAIHNLVEQINVQRARIRWNIELAGAYAARGNTYKQMAASQYAAWLNIRHSPRVFPIDLVGLARITKTLADPARALEQNSLLDYGVALSKQGGNFDVQLEYVNRNNLDLKRSYDRLVFVANYKLMPGIVGVVSFGKDFNEADEVFTAFGIRFGLSRQAVN